MGTTDDLRELRGTIDTMHSKLDAVLQGTHDANGQWHPGLSPTVKDHARRIDDLEAAAEEQEKRQMNWRHALGLTLAGGVITQALTWLRDHLR